MPGYRKGKYKMAFAIWGALYALYIVEQQWTDGLTDMLVSTFIYTASLNNKDF